VIGRHEHHHLGAGGLGPTGALDRESRAEVAARDDHRHTPGHVPQAEVEQRVALNVQEGELLGVVRQDTDAVHALVDHAVEHAPLTLEVEVARVGERCRRDGKDSRKQRRRGELRHRTSSWWRLYVSGTAGFPVKVCGRATPNE